jgi:hypothetical protein
MNKSNVNHPINSSKEPLQRILILLIRKERKEKGTISTMANTM